MNKIPENIKKKLLDYAFVTAVGTGKGRGERHENGEEAVVAFVEEKKAESELDEKDILPKQVDGWKVDVQPIGKIEIEPLNVQKRQDTGEVDTTARHRPNPQGVSIGHPDVTAGTAGFVAWQKQKKHGVTYAEPVGVTNNHVAADVNEAEEGDKILQPGSLDGGDESIGTLEGYVPITENDNKVDAAWYSIDGRNSNSYIPSIGVPTETVDVAEGDEVKKFARTTGLRKGKVRSTGARVRVNYSNGLKEFENQIITESISTGGDSGSAVVTEDGKLAGLLFAGSSQVTVANPAQKVLDEAELYLTPEEVYNK